VIANVRADIGKSYPNVDAALNAMADAGSNPPISTA
jgi:hypothetical protein